MMKSSNGFEKARAKAYKRIRALGQAREDEIEKAVGYEKSCYVLIHADGSLWPTDDDLDYNSKLADELRAKRVDFSSKWTSAPHHDCTDTEDWNRAGRAFDKSKVYSPSEDEERFDIKHCAKIKDAWMKMSLRRYINCDWTPQCIVYDEIDNSEWVGEVELVTETALNPLECPPNTPTGFYIKISQLKEGDDEGNVTYTEPEQFVRLTSEEVNVVKHWFDEVKGQNE